MGSLRETLLLCAVLLVAAPLAAAQEDPTVNESDMDSSDPGYDESYLDDGNATAAGGDDATASEDPALSESDFDMAAPPADESYLGEAAGPDASAGSAETFGPGLALAMAAALLAALVVRRR